MVQKILSLRPTMFLFWYCCWHVYFWKKALLRYSWHTINCTYVKYLIDMFWFVCLLMKPSPRRRQWAFLHPKFLFVIPSIPCPLLATTDVLSVRAFHLHFLDFYTSSITQYALFLRVLFCFVCVCFLFCLALFSWNNYFGFILGCVC